VAIKKDAMSNKSGSNRNLFASDGTSKIKIEIISNNSDSTLNVKKLDKIK
jgi:hypothetical protein